MFLTECLLQVCYHHSDCTPYVVLAGVFYAIDHAVRMVKTRITTATLRPIPELGLTRVEVPSINAGWRAGQHVRLRVLSTGMGIWGMTEVHPFTIASVSQTEEGLVLLCKKSGRWTSRMYEMANTSTYGDHGKELGTSVKVMVEGPYGMCAPSCTRSGLGLSCVQVVLVTLSSRATPALCSLSAEVVSHSHSPQFRISSGAVTPVT